MISNIVAGNGKSNYIDWNNQYYFIMKHQLINKKLNASII